MKKIFNKIKKYAVLLKGALTIKVPKGHCKACLQNKWTPVIMFGDPMKVCKSCSYAEVVDEKKFEEMFGIRPKDWFWIQT